MFIQLYHIKFIVAEAVAQRFSVKKVFLEISQNSQENTCARVSILIKFQRTPLVAASFVVCSTKIFK